MIPLALPMGVRGTDKVAQLRLPDALVANEAPSKPWAAGSYPRRLGEPSPQSVTIDWRVRESARAKIKIMVKRILRKHAYPPDLQDAATKLVLAQAELLCASWA